MRRLLKNKFLLMIPILAILLWAFIGSKGELVENLDIPIGVGYDMEKDKVQGIEYKVPIAVYIFSPSGEISSRVVSGKAPNIAETRDERQLKINRKFLLGLEKVFVISENQAQFGVRNMVDILFNNSQINDRSLMVVCKGKAEDILKHKMKGYPNPADFISGLIKSQIDYNFFGKEFSLMDLIVRIDSEGRNVLLPYMELKDGEPQITGTAIFKKDKMIGKADVDETRIISLLKFDKRKGTLSIQKNPKEYINFYAESKRKVRCYKNDGKYRFVIDLELNGSLVSNTLYPSLNKDPETLKKFQKDMELKVKLLCKEYIDKIKSKYKIDFLDLGREAVAKYGRETGTDWDKVVSDSDIEVNVKVKVIDEGRGSY